MLMELSWASGGGVKRGVFRKNLKMVKTSPKKLITGVFRVLACADMGARTPLGVRQYWSSGVRAPAVDLHTLVAPT